MKDVRHEYDDDGFDASAFEAEMRLSLSLANQAIAKRHGRTAAPLPVAGTPLPFQVRPLKCVQRIAAARADLDSLGVGAKPAVKPQQSLGDAKLRQQLMPKKRRREDDEAVAAPAATADASDDDEDSRANAFKAKATKAPIASTSTARPAASAAMPAPAGMLSPAVAANGAALSKSERKKLRKLDRAAAAATANGGKTLGALADLAGYGSGSSRVTSPALSSAAASVNGRPSASPRPEKLAFSPPPSATRPKPPYAPLVPPEEESSDGGAAPDASGDVAMSDAEAEPAAAMDVDPPPDARLSTPEPAPAATDAALSKSQRRRKKRQEAKQRKAEAGALTTNGTPG